MEKWREESEMGGYSGGLKEPASRVQFSRCVSFSTFLW